MSAPRPKNLARVLLAAVLSAAISVVAAGTSSAGLLVETATDCAAQPLAQPFKRWGDSANYTLLPGGTFEDGAPAWTLSRATRVNGNEPFYVHGRLDRKSLSIRPGGHAVSRSICVGLEHPTMRFFARSSGILPLMSVEVITETSLGAQVSLPIGVVTPRSSYGPTPTYIILANLLPLLPNNYTAVAFRFRAVTGTWTIDDAYVDPKKH